MWSISGSTEGARSRGAGLAVAVALALLCSACVPDEGREPSPLLYLSPRSALQQATLTVTLTAQGAALSTCDLSSPANLAFESPGGEAQITAHSLGALDDTTLRADITVEPEAVVGTHSVKLLCDANTTMEGDFDIRERLEDPLLTLTPDTAAAGSSNLEIEIAAEDTYFIEDLSHVVFGDGTDVAVKDEDLATGAKEMWVTVDVSPLAAVGEMEVAVVTGSVVSRGTFEVTERIYSTVQVTPDQITRPAVGDVPVQATLQIAGEGTFFESAPPDAGPTEGTRVSFPGNPGIEVTLVDVDGPTNMETNILVSSQAPLGPWPLTVETASGTMTTDFTVLPPSGEPVLSLTPMRIGRGCQRRLVFAEMTGLLLNESSTAQSLTSDCAVEDFEVLSGRKMALWISVDDSFVEESAVVEVSAGSQSAGAMLVVSEPDGPFLLPPAPQAVAQGYTGYITLEVEGYTFSPAAVASVGERSGLKMVNQTPWADGSAITALVEVATDAPVGPLEITVADGPEEMVTYLGITPSGSIPYIEAAPSVLPPGRTTLVVTLQAVGFTPFAGEFEIATDRTGVEIADLQVLSDESARLVVDVSPAVEDGEVAFYLSSPAQSAAARCRTRGCDRAWATATDATLERGDEEREALLYAQLEGMTPEGITSQIFDGIGVQVERITAIDEETVELEMTVMPDGEENTWPGGWFGVVLSSWDGKTVLPVYLDGADDSLTMAVSPSEIAPGTSKQLVSAALPDGAILSPALAAATCQEPEARVGVYDITSSSQALVSLDLSYTPQAAEGPVAVGLIGSKGAGIGFFETWDLASEDVSGSLDWEGALGDGETLLIQVDPGAVPSQVVCTDGRDGYADLKGTLIEGEGTEILDATEAGRIYVLDDGLLAVQPAEDPGALESAVFLRSIGGGAEALAEPDDEFADAYQITGDPCDTPFLGVSLVEGALDIDRVQIDGAACRLVAQVVARRMGNRVWATPDSMLALVDEWDVTLDTSQGWPDGTFADPSIFMDPFTGVRQLVVGAQMGTAGLYLLNIRRPVAINEVCRGVSGAFVEVEVEPGQVLDGLTVELIDADSGAVQAALPLTGTAPEDGLLVIGDASETWVDLDDTTGVTVIGDADPFAIRISDGAGEVDAIQVGGTGDHGEGAACINDSALCFERFARVDTGDNLMDFVQSWRGTPGE